MITNTGKNILSKFLISQAPAYASYISIGCGQKPLVTGGTFGDYSDQTNMEFEMLRLPIVSRGYIKDDDDIEKIVFTAELPTAERYEITEVGVYSAGGNPSAVGFDSRMLYTFSESEGWEYIDAASIIDSQIPTPSPVVSNESTSVIDTTHPAFFFTSTNIMFASANRVARYERPRILNGSLAIVGNTATLSQAGEDAEMLPGIGSDYLRLTGTSVNFNKNAPTDILKMAFSVMNKNGNEDTEIPDQVKILVQFASSSNPGIYANMQVTLGNGTGEGNHDFTTNRYVVVSKQLQELYYRPAFSWGLVDEIRIYSSVIKSSSASDDYYVAFDGIRIENVSTQNPLYGLTGYTVMMTEGGKTVVKNLNTKNYIEFRFGLDVGI